MLNNAAFYEKFSREVSELSDVNGVPLVDVVLPKDFCDILSKNIKLPERANIINNGQLGVNINVDSEYQADCVKYSIMTKKRKREYRVSTSEISIIVSSSENAEEVSFYQGICSDSQSNVYKYYFIRKTRDGILVFNVDVSMHTGELLFYKISSASITETFYNKETAEAIGDAYLDPKILAGSHYYGIKYDSSTTHDGLKSLRDINELFNKRCDELLRNNYSKSMTNGTNNDR